jgi:hypothetical protein
MKFKKVVGISVIVAAGLAVILTALPASTFAHGAGSLSVAVTSNPRFPIAGQQAELTFRPVFNDGTPNTGQVPMVMLQWSSSGEHTHGGAAEEPAAPAQGGSMAGMDMGGTPAPAGGAPPEIMLMPVESSPGVYVANVTFVQGGPYVSTFSIGDDEVDTTIGVRAGPVSWFYVGALAGLIFIGAATVAVVKTVRRSW